jgi:hypothetical protein
MSQVEPEPPLPIRRHSKPSPPPEAVPMSEPGPEIAASMPEPESTSTPEPVRSAAVRPDPLQRDVTRSLVKVAQYYPDPDPKAGLSDQEWLETLPLYAQLKGAARRIFAEDALIYRRLWAARRAIVQAFREARFANDLRRQEANTQSSPKRGRMRGQFQRRTWGWVRLNNPENWSVCDPERGGCGGVGWLSSTRRCPICRGNGYHIGIIDRLPRKPDESPG